MALDIKQKAGRLNQLLEERAYLTFEFSPYIVRRLPFFENPIISESKKSIYVKYQPLSRPSTIFSYFGAEARQFNLSFKLTLPHIINFVSKDLFSLTFPKKVQTGYEDFFTNPNKPLDNYSHKIPKFSADDLDREYFSHILAEQSDLYEGTIETALRIQSVKNNLIEQSKNSSEIDKKSILLQVLEYNGDNTKLKLRKLALDYILYWVSLVRSSVLNNAEDPKQGPPIVRINYGTLYRDIPCICTDYKISEVQEAGMDANTLTPRSIEISMTLLEHRHGDFGKYKTEEVKRDNVVGWEAVIYGSHSVDPLPIYDS